MHYGLVRVHNRGHAAFVARILIIDDDEAFRTLLLQMLLEAGHTAVAAVNGMEALKLFRTEPADLILTDIMMPYGGLATIRILHDEFPQAGVIMSPRRPLATVKRCACPRPSRETPCAARPPGR